MRKRGIDWTAQCCALLKFPVRLILDYGCGDSANLPDARRATLKAEQLLGVDVSSASIALARHALWQSGISFLCIKRVDARRHDRSGLHEWRFPSYSSVREASVPRGDSSRSPSGWLVRLLGK